MISSLSWLAIKASKECVRKCLMNYCKAATEQDTGKPAVRNLEAEHFSTYSGAQITVASAADAPWNQKRRPQRVSGLKATVFEVVGSRYIVVNTLRTTAVSIYRARFLLRRHLIDANFSRIRVPGI